MNLIKKAKKGFTLVELVVVIAVIAILAAVSVVSYVAITKKANQSADNQLIAEVNTSLAGLDATKKPKTMYEAVHAIEEDGLRVDKLQERTKGWHYAYSLEKNRFIIVDDAGKTVAGPEGFGDVEPSKLWMFADDTSDITETYAYYLRGKQTISEPLTIKTSFDVGENTISSLTYSHPTSDKEVLVRTNGGTFTVNAPAGTVKHHGEATTLKIVEVKTSSYHENGTVSFAEISKGRIVLEKGSDVSHIHVNKKNDTSFDEVIIAKDQQVEMPNLSRDDVTIGSSGTLVVALQEGTGDVSTSGLDYVWLTKQGIYEQIKVSDSSTSAGDVWADSSTVSEETQEAAQQIANNYISESVRPKWSSADDAERDLADINNASAVAEAVAKEEAGDAWEIMTEEAKAEAVQAQESVVVNPEAAVEKTADKEEAQKGATLFAGGSGTKFDPFLIVDQPTFLHISDMFNDGYYYFKVKDGIKEIDLSNVGGAYLNGSFDGNGAKLINTNGYVFRIARGLDNSSLKRVSIKNFTVSFDGGFGIVNTCGTPSLEFSNVYALGYLLEDWNAGVFLRYGSYNYDGVGFDYEVTFNNCSSRTEVYSSTNAFSSILIGHGYTGSDHVLTLNIDSATDNAIDNTVLYYTGTATVPFGYKYYGMSSKNVIVNIDGEEVYSGAYGSFAGNKITGSNIVKIVSNLNPSKESDGAYTITPENDTSKIVVSFNWQYTEWEDDYSAQIAELSGVGGTFSEKLVFEVNGNDSLTLLEKLNSVEIRINQQEWGYELANGKLILKMTTSNPYIDGHVTMHVEQFTQGSNVAKYKGSFELATKTKAADWVIK